jgi:phosphate transport system substrate-binding protein
MKIKIRFALWGLTGLSHPADAVDAGTYPLARPLYIYSAPNIMQEKQQVADYVNFFLTYVNEEVIGVGYFPASDAALEQSRVNWQVAMGELPESEYAASYTMTDEAPMEEETAEEPAEEMEEEMMEAGIMEDGTAVLPAVDPLAISGNIVSAGSSTVFPLAERMAERFQEEGYSDQITIDSIGSGGGFSRFCEAGETDVSNASRPIRDSEVEACQAIGREPLEFRVGTDALAVVVSQDNDFADDLTIEELAVAFSTAETWADVRDGFPAEPIQRFIPGTDSGTFDYFVEEVFEEDPEPILSASNLQLSEDDNVLVQGIQASPYAIGFFGYAYYNENQDTLKALGIDGVEPSGEAVDAGTYPLARPLFIYSSPNIMQEKQQVADYINFFLTYVNDEVIGVGYFPASDAALNEARTLWLVGMGMADADAVMGGEEEMEMAEMIELPAVDPLAVSGNIVSAGSSTVFPLAERMAERFQEEGYSDQITIDSIGSGGGFSRFCEAGETDVSNASRPIRDSEVEACQAIGREPLEFRVGTDALAVVVSQDNDFADDLTIEELAVAFSTAETWADVRDGFPAEPIQRFIPGTDSGTFDYFVEEVFEEDPEPILSASNLQLSEDDNVLVQGIQASPYAIGFFGYAYYNENQDTLKALGIDGVEPSGEAVDAGTYPLARPLFIYSSPNIMQEKQQVADYINFFLTYVNEEVIGVGYFPASDAALNEAKQLWLDAMGQ